MKQPMFLVLPIFLSAASFPTPEFSLPDYSVPSAQISSTSDHLSVTDLIFSDRYFGFTPLKIFRNNIYVPEAGTEKTEKAIDSSSFEFVGSLSYIDNSAKQELYIFSTSNDKRIFYTYDREKRITNTRIQHQDSDGNWTVTPLGSSSAYYTMSYALDGSLLSDIQGASGTPWSGHRRALLHLGTEENSGVSYSLINEQWGRYTGNYDTSRITIQREQETGEIQSISENIHTASRSPSHTRQSVHLNTYEVNRASNGYGYWVNYTSIDSASGKAREHRQYQYTVIGSTFLAMKVLVHDTLTGKWDTTNFCEFRYEQSKDMLSVTTTQKSSLPTIERTKFDTSGRIFQKYSQDGYRMTRTYISDNSDDAVGIGNGDNALSPSAISLTVQGNRVQFSHPQEKIMTCGIYTLNGRQISILSGTEINFTAPATGVYIYRISSSNIVKNGRLVIK